MGAGRARNYILIVVDRPEGTLLVVRQTDHAAASSVIARRWRRPVTIPNGIWQRFLEAVHRHDDGWEVEENRSRLDRHGRPLDFKSIQTPDHVAVWQRTLDHLESEDRFMAVVVAQHARWLYTHVGQANIEDRRAAIDFVETLSERISRCLATLSVGDREDRVAVEPRLLSRFRALLSLFDRLSLSLVGGLHWVSASEEVAFGSGQGTIRMRADSEGVMLSPWPFEGPAWHLETIARYLPHRRFTGPGQLDQTLLASPTIRLLHRIAPTTEMAAC